MDPVDADAAPKPALDPVFGEGFLVCRPGAGDGASTGDDGHGPDPGAGPDEGPVLAVGDLHLGYERELLHKGFKVPSQTETLADAIAEAVRRAGARRVVLLGDVKHTIPFTSRAEEAEVEAFFDRLLDAVDVVDIARGNHDAALKPHLPEGVALRPAGGFAVGGTGFLHGHSWPADEVAEATSDGGALVTGHVHPAVSFVDDLGGRHKEPCWLRGQVTDVYRERYGLPDGMPVPEVVVLPAAHPLLGGTAVNEETPPGPLFRSGAVDLEGAQVTTLDGIDLGQVGDLREIAGAEDAGAAAGGEEE